MAWLAFGNSWNQPFLLADPQICRWFTLGLLAVENIRGAQEYIIPSPMELRYLSLQMHGSYGKETFCTMSGVQVSQTQNLWLTLDTKKVHRCTVKQLWASLSKKLIEKRT
jgi:hypothetical protein